MKKINVIGAGLAGSEAAYFLLKAGYEVHLYEMRPVKMTEAHETDKFGELVCSNSLKGKAISNACGLLKEEIRLMDSIMMEAALQSEVPSGGALSVDREKFSELITNRIKSFPNLIFHNEEVTELKDDEYYIIATGPLTSEGLFDKIKELTNEDSLFFFDASAPIIRKDSINMDIAYYKSRYDQDDDSYINCPFSKEEYDIFYHELINAKLALVHEFDKHYFEGCMPIEVMAKRGKDTIRFGPLKPKGLEVEGKPKPYAVVQLRQDNLLNDLYNIVGFQTNLTYGEQKRVFSLIPGLENVIFVKYGQMHRNSYVNAPKVLNEDLSIKGHENIYIAGQLSGVEGYVESAATGLLAAIYLKQKIEKKPQEVAPIETMLGSLTYYITHANEKNFTPMNANFGILFGANKHNHEEIANKALEKIKEFYESNK